MPREILLNAFDMHCVGHIQQGLWTHPRDQSTRYNTLAYWTEMARTLEAALFDGIFLADVVGVYDVYGGNADAALRGGVQVPVNDPMLLIPAMAAATQHLGFGVTANLVYEAPYLFARRMSTLDHLTGGRVGWNIVTGYLDSAARANGLSQQMAHDDRYDLADEYMQLVYQLWQHSWADDAVRADKASGVYADPAKVRLVHHHGKQYTVDAMHLCEPSPQRTPVLYQAGSSPRGRRFAAQHAECVFLNGQSVAGVKAIVEPGGGGTLQSRARRRWRHRQPEHHGPTPRARRARPSRTGVRQSSAAPAAPGARPGCRRRGASGARRRAPGGGPGRTHCAPCQHRSPHLLPMADPDRQAPSAEAWMARLESRYAMAAQRHAHQVSSDTDGASPLRPDTEPDYF